MYPFTGEIKLYCESVDGDETKDFFGNTSSPFKLITRKPIIPDADEQAMNPRSRSAKLRVIERKAEYDD